MPPGTGCAPHWPLHVEFNFVGSQEMSERQSATQRLYDVPQFRRDRVFIAEHTIEVLFHEVAVPVPPFGTKLLKSRTIGGCGLLYLRFVACIIADICRYVPI